MDSAKTIAVGSAIEVMTETEGWKYLDQWIKDRETEYMQKLKKAGSWDEVLKLQAMLEMIDRIKCKVRDSISNKNKELNYEVNKQ